MVDEGREYVERALASAEAKVIPRCLQSFFEELVSMNLPTFCPTVYKYLREVILGIEEFDRPSYVATELINQSDSYNCGISELIFRDIR